jgi:hypothetical protein
MINRYNEFILEKRIYSLILENDLKASSDFKDKLFHIKDRSKIADILYNVFNDEEYISSDLPQNWIDVTDKDDTITFISDVKADKWMSENDEDDDNSPFNMKGRSDVKVGRFVRAFLTNPKITSEIDYDGVKFTDKDYEDFVNLYKASNTKSPNRFEIVSGNDIKKCYLEDNYTYGDDKGQLGSSCMRYEGCQDFLGVYVKNSSCRLLVYLDESNKVLGRALVWKLSKSPSPAEYFMDRIYTAFDSDIIKFQNYADSNGWMRKYKNSSDDIESVLFSYKGQVVVGNIEITLDKAKFDNYPFMDTVSYVGPKSKIASNVNGKGMLVCTDTDGDSYSCSTCDGSGKYSGDCHDCYNGETYCEKCNGAGKIRCMDCRGSGIKTGTEKNCDTCKGRGSVIKTIRRVKCKECDGRGSVGEKCTSCESGQKKCLNCEGGGRVKCHSCDGKGEFENAPCPECTNGYKTVLREIIGWGGDRYKTISELAKKELERISVPVKKEKKESKKKKEK